jgi:hypothetical protein
MVLGDLPGDGLIGLEDALEQRLVGELGRLSLLSLDVRYELVCGGVL